MRTMRTFVAIFAILALLSGCAGMSDQSRTQAEGTGVGAVVGGLLGYVIGGDEGAVVGAALGAGAGFLVGNEVAKRKQAYASSEDFLDAEIANTQEYNQTAIAYNAKMKTEIATLEKESKRLRTKYDKGQIDKETLVAKSEALQKKLDANAKLEENLAKELEVQTAILEQERKDRPADDQYIARLEKEVQTLQNNLGQLREGSTQLAKIDQRLSV